MDKDIQTSCPAADPQPVVQSAGPAATFIVGLGAPQWVLTIALVYVAIASFITVVQRVWTVYRQTRSEGATA